MVGHNEISRSLEVAPLSPPLLHTWSKGQRFVDSVPYFSQRCLDSRFADVQWLLLFISVGKVDHGSIDIQRPASLLPVTTMTMKSITLSW